MIGRAWIICTACAISLLVAGGVSGEWWLLAVSLVVACVAAAFIEE